MRTQMRLTAHVWAAWYLLYLLVTEDSLSRKMVKGVQIWAIITGLYKLAKEIKKYLDSQCRC